MMNVYYLEVTTDSGGDGVASVVLPLPLEELLYAVEWIDGDLADGVDAVLSCVGQSGVARTLLALTDANADAMYYPRELEDDNTGTEGTTNTLAVVEGTLTLTVSSGGDTATGGCRVYTVEV